MATVILSERAKADAEELVREGRFETMDEAVAAGLRFLRDPWIDEEVDLDDLDPETRAAVQEGLADIEAGRVRSGEEVRADLEARFGKLRR